MQDIHWTDGSFGYFPSYTLGAIYAAQWFHCIQQQISDVEAQIETGDLSQISKWLNDNIWQKASFLITPELVQAASGEALNQYMKEKGFPPAQQHIRKETLAPLKHESSLR